MNLCIATPLQHVNLTLDHMPHALFALFTCRLVRTTAHGSQPTLQSHQRMGNNGQPHGSAQIILGDLSGASLALQRHWSAWRLQSAAGYLSGHSSKMWHGDPLGMRSAGYYLQIGLTHQGLIKGKIVARFRPSGWSGRLVIQVDLNKAFHSDQKSGKLLLTDDSPVI